MVTPRPRPAAPRLPALRFSVTLALGVLAGLGLIASFVWSQVHEPRITSLTTAALAGFLLLLLVRYSHRQQRERDALIEEASLAYQTIQRTSEAVFWVRQDGSFVDANLAACRMFGYEKAELLKRWVGDLDVAMDRAAWQRMWAEVERHGVMRVEARLRTRDGRIIHAIVADNALEHRGQPLHCAVIRDISDFKEREQRLSIALQAAEAGLWDWKIAQQLITTNDRFFRMVGQEPDPSPWTEQAWTQRIHEEDRAKVAAALAASGAQDLPFVAEFRFRCADGRYKWIRSHGLVVERRDDGSPARIIGQSVDITQQKLTALQLQSSEKRFALAVESARDGLWDYDLPSGRVYYANRFRQILGLDEAELGDRLEDWLARVASSHLNQFTVDLELTSQGLKPRMDTELQVVHGDGELRWLRCRALPECDEGGTPVRLVGSISDVTELKATYAALRRQAETDPLTGLANRRAFTDRVATALRISQRRGDHQVALLFFDFDRFKTINDSLGHEAGDELLRHIARRLSEQLGPHGLAARFGGDEFAVLLENITASRQAQDAAEQFLQVLAKPYMIANQEVVSTASIGLVIAAGGTKSADAMLRDADAAMYQAKVAGRGRCVVFDEPMHRRAVRLLSLESDLRHALARGQMQLHYQPIIAVESGRMVGAEALMRWQHPEEGWVSPAEFVGIAEESGLIVALGQWALQEACRQMVAWDALGLAIDTINVNVSKRQLLQQEMVSIVADALRQHALDPRRLCLEVTESTVCGSRSDVTPRLRELRSLGVKLAMDDFGTGHSSLSNLHLFPLDSLKIDRSFVHNLKSGYSFSAVLHAIVSLAQNLGLHVVAEGVEDVAQLAQIQAMDCPYVQGYWFAPPMPPDALASWAASRATGTLRQAG